MKIKNQQTPELKKTSKEEAIKSASQMVECIEFRIFFISLIPLDSFRRDIYFFIRRLKAIKGSAERLERYLKHCEENPTNAQKKNIEERLVRMEVSIHKNSKLGTAMVFGRPEILTPYLEPCYGYIGKIAPFKEKKKKK